MKPRDFKTHATYFNILSPISELSDYRIYNVLIQGFRFGKFVQVRGRTETLTTQVNIQ